MTQITRLLVAIGNSPAASILVKTTLALVLGLAAVFVARKSAASFRHALLAALFLVLAVLPVASVVAPSWNIAVRGADRDRSAPTFAQFAAGKAIPRPRAAAAPVTPPPRDSSIPTLLFAVWLAGATLFLFPVVMGLYQVRSLRRSAVPWRRGEALGGRRVELLIHQNLPGPMTCGILRPAVVLPAEAESWNAADLERAVIHELEHVRRNDWLSQCLARMLCTLYWFHPLVWVAWRQFKLEAERSCDDVVLRRSEATAYADQLVGLARRLSAAKSPLLAMANRADLSKRVSSLLDTRRRRSGAGKLAAAFACTAAIAIVALSPVRIVAAPQASSDNNRMANIRSMTSLVQTTVTVADENGRPVELLNAADFAVSEDGVPQKIMIFEAQQATYILGYYPRNNTWDGSFRKITITGKLPMMAKLDYRPGYYASPIVESTSGAALPAAGPPDVRPPVILFKYEPEYSDAARKAKYQGTVRLVVGIDPSGKVAEVKVLRSLGLGLDESAIDALQRWRFRPATQNGQPVATTIAADVIFRLL